MNMKRRQSIALLFSGALLLSLRTGPAHALFGVGDIVFDPSAYAQLVAQVQNLTRLYNTAVDQLRKAEATYQAITGVRNVATLYRAVADIASYDALPRDAQKVVLDTAKLLTQFSILEQQIDQARRETTQLTEKIFRNPESSEAKRWRQNVERISRQYGTGVTLYNTAAKRTDTIQGLIEAIRGTTDPMAVQQLQARIAGEGDLIQNEHNKLVALKMTQDARREQIEQQEHDAILGVGKKGIPDTKFTWPGK